MLKSRTHTFYLKHLEINHPLKKLYENPDKQMIQNFEQWKITNNIYKDNYPTNVHIVFH